MNIVLIPCWRRDDFLTVTLEHIISANRADENCYVFMVDRGYKDGIMQVIDSFPLSKEVHVQERHRYRGNSFNVLEGYKIAASKGANLVYLIEEDIWVGKDFFDFHESVQSRFDPFCLSAVRCQNDPTRYPQDPSCVYYHHTFQSLGISWKADKLNQIVEHAKPEYYRSMAGYLRRTFPKTRFGDQWIEQDGLINRILETSEIKCMYPYVARAFHAGFVGYNRRGAPLDGTREERAAILRHMNQDDMNNRAADFKDITPIDTSVDYGVKEFQLK